LQNKPTTAVKEEALSPLPTNGAYMHHETCSFMMSYPAMSLGDRFYVSRKGGRWVGTPEGYKQHGHVWAWL